MPEQEYIKLLYEKKEYSINQIRKQMGINWRTAAKYAHQDDWNQDCNLRERRKPIMDTYAEIVDTWLMEDLLKNRKDRQTAAVIYRRLCQEYGFPGKDRTVRQYVANRKRELGAERQEKYLRLDHQPGEAQVDFGTTRVIWEKEIREIRFLAISFPYSNAGFCVPVPGENIECFLHAMIQMFTWSEGVPPDICFDNLAAAVASIGKGQDRKLTETFQRFKLHYRFEAVFCNAGKGNEKGNVENKVGYSRRNWLLPYPEVSSYEQLTAELYRRAIADMQRSHYEKGRSIASLWEEDQKALLPLPAVPFEPVQLTTARINKYGQFHCSDEVYVLPSAPVGEMVLIKLWWDRVEVFNRHNERLAVLPRHYTLKTQPIDWQGYFGIFVRKPRGARHATMYRFLPPEIKDYLEGCEAKDYKNRLQLIYSFLQEGFRLDLIARALAATPPMKKDDIGFIRHQLYRLTHPEVELPVLNEAYTPASVRGYDPATDVYDRLLPQTKVPGGDANASRSLVGTM